MVRLALPALIVLLSVAGYFVTREIVRRDGHHAAQRRAELESVQLQGVLDRARGSVVGLGSALASEPVPTQPRFAQLQGIGADGAGLTEWLWVEHVNQAQRAAYERRIGAPITVADGSARPRPAPRAASYLPLTFATPSAARRLRRGADLSTLPELGSALGDRALVFAVTASRRAALGGRSGFYLMQSGRFGRGPGSRGFLVAFVPSGWLTVSLGDDPRRVAISLEGQPLEGRLADRSAAHERFDALARRWRIDVGPVSEGALREALPWIALVWPVAVAVLVYVLGRGLLRRRRAEREVDRVFELSLDLLCVVGVDGTFRRVNPAFERTLGYTAEDLVRRPFMDFVYPDDRAATAATYTAVLEGETVLQFENRFLRADGSACWLQWSVRPMPAEGVMYAAGRDVTERRRTQDELRRAQRLVEASRDELRVLADEQAALRRVATLVARGERPNTVFDAMVVEVGRLLGADSAGLTRYEPDGTGTLVCAWHGADQGVEVGTQMAAGPGTLLDDVRRQRRALRRRSSQAGTDAALAARLSVLGLRTIVGAPVVVEGRLWGVISGGWRGDDRVPADAEGRIGQFTELVATAIANAEGRAELAASRARIVAASDATRRRIERDLHDGAQQRLVSLALALRAAEAAVEPGQEALRAELEQTADGLASVLEDLQEMSRGIHPAILSKGGIGPALKTLARRSAVPVELDVRADGRLPESVEAGAYYVVSEALANAAKHAQASVVYVAVTVDDGAISIAIRDDGIGGAHPGRGSGLTGLRDRVEALGGTLEIESGVGRGTALRARIPVRPPAVA
ncbi:hypothetical protein DSM104299_04204 [Baekduia alba]|uniref:PAS domain S-box protein n=1 Tax=Baekduia alba TaxID=2997333 RepID=UPI0023406FEA|nr:PAS domain S-box protein [Baekduia alba]WCB95459.1 hypothetical protein DSM104299_04204 [Baekduia alba]